MGRPVLRSAWVYFKTHGILPSRHPYRGNPWSNGRTVFSAIDASWQWESVDSFLPAAGKFPLGSPGDVHGIADIDEFPTFQEGISVTDRNYRLSFRRRSYVT